MYTIQRRALASTAMNLRVPQGVSAENLIIHSLIKKQALENLLTGVTQFPLNVVPTAVFTFCGQRIASRLKVPAGWKGGGFGFK